MVYRLERSQACVKARLSDHPEQPVHPDQQNIKKKKKERPITVIACWTCFRSQKTCIIVSAEYLYEFVAFTTPHNSYHVIITSLNKDVIW